MNYYFSLFLSAILFVTQSWALCLHAEAAGDENAKIDYRVKISLEVDRQGDELQKLQDREGIEAAHQYFEKMANENMQAFLFRSSDAISKMGEKEAVLHLEKIQEYLNKMGGIPNEERINKVSSILYDHSLSNKEKLMSFQGDQETSSFKKGIEMIKNRASIVGYQKAFHEISNQLRSRYDTGGYWGDLSDPAIPIGFGIFILGFIVLLISPDAYMVLWTAAMVVGFGTLIWAIVSTE